MRLLRGKPASLIQLIWARWVGHPAALEGILPVLEGMDTERGMIRISFIDFFFFNII